MKAILLLIVGVLSSIFAGCASNNYRVGQEMFQDIPADAQVLLVLPSCPGIPGTICASEIPYEPPYGGFQSAMIEYQVNYPKLQLEQLRQSKASMAIREYFVTKSSTSINAGGVVMAAASAGLIAASAILAPGLNSNVGSALQGGVVGASIGTQDSSLTTTSTVVERNKIMFSIRLTNGKYKSATCPDDVLIKDCREKFFEALRQRAQPK